jgi:hypothetical protein
MLHAVSPRSFSAAALVRTLVLLVLPLFGNLQAQQNVPMVAGHFAGAFGFNTFEFTVFGTELPNGRTIGWFSYERVYDNGTTPPITEVVEAPIDELIIVGETAYLRVGQYYIALADRAAANTPEPDRFTVVRFLFSTPALPTMLGILDRLMGFNGVDVTLGNVHVQD